MRTLLALLILTTPAAAQWGRDSFVQPTTYVSDSGAWSLRVDPSTPDGRASAAYRMLHEGHEAWSETLPYTLVDVHVADSGVSAGYAYTSKFVVATLAADGKPLRVDETARTPSRFVDSHENPVARGMLFQESIDRFIVRIDDENSNPGSEQWWVFRLSTGERLETQDPRSASGGQRNRARLRAAQVVRGTPLILVDWLEFPDLSAFEGRFSILDAKGGKVWELMRPREYADGHDFDLLDSLSRNSSGAILRCVELRSFELWLVKDRQRARFEVAAGEAGTWVVREVSRRPQPELDEPVPVAPPPPAERLALAGMIELDAGSSEPAVHGVGAFTLDGQGNIAFLSWEYHPDRVVLAYVDREGKQIARHPLALGDPEDGSVSGPIEWLRDSDVLVPFSTRSRANRGPGRICRVSALTGEAHEFASIEGGEIHDLARTPDGGVLVLGDNRLESIGPDGKRRWVRTSSDSLCGATDIAVSADGSIVALDQGGGALQWIRADGKIGRYDRLEKLHGRKPRYLGWIEPDLDGGWMLEDADELLRLDERGKLLGEFVPRFANGRLLQCRDRVRLGPDGRRWASDHHALVALAADGHAERVLGDGPDTERLGRVAGLEIDRADRIHALSARSGNVFVFTSTGELQFVAHSAPEDLGSDPYFESNTLVVGAQGEIFLVIGNRCVHWSSDGKRIGLEPWSEDRYGPRLVPQGIAGNTWRIEDQALALVGKDGKELSRITRRPDGTWLQPRTTAIVAPDGSIAVVCADSAKQEADGTSVAIAGADGALRSVLQIGQRGSVPYEITYDGRHLAGIADSRLHLVDLSTGKANTYELAGVPSDHDSSWRPFLAHTRDELWLFDGQHTLRRYPLSTASAPR